MRAAKQFALRLQADGELARTERIKVELFGSLGFTGKGHGSDRAIILGLQGDEPATTKIETVAQRVQLPAAPKRLALFATHEIDFDPADAIVFHRREKLPLHAN